MGGKAMRNVLQRSLPVLVSVLCVLALVTAAPAGTYTLKPTDDVCCRSDEPNTAGTAAGSLLYVGGAIADSSDYWVTYIKFDLSASASGTVNGATLYLTLQAVSSGGITVSTYECTNDPYDWDEQMFSQQTADTTLTISTTSTANTFVTTAGNKYSFSVTVPAQNHQGGNLTIVVKEQNQPTSGKWAAFYSKDYPTNASYRPYLSLSYTPPSDDDGYIGHIDFDPSLTIDNLAEPSFQDPLDALITFEQLTDGMTSCAFAANVPPETGSDVVFEPLVPGATTEGDWDTGVVMSFPCTGSAGDVVTVGVLHMVYQGVPGDIMLLSHPDYPEMVIDCQNPGQVQTFCVMSHGGVNKTPLAGDCGITPVLDKTWGAIKALYR
jgi:hypothetical protein